METQDSPSFAIRTITAGVNLDPSDSLGPFEDAVQFLDTARRRFESSGLVVQSTRIATQPQSGFYRAHSAHQSLVDLQKLDQAAEAAGHLVSIGPLLEDDEEASEFPHWAAELVAGTQHLFFSIVIASPPAEIHGRSIHTAAETILAISNIGENGEANFRFGAAARVPASTPFFPVAYHWGKAAFSIGLESAGLVGKAFATATDPGSADSVLRPLLETVLTPVQELAQELSVETSLPFLGIDLSPAPSLDASIAGPIEVLTGQPFGSPSTLVACAAVTRALDAAELVKCGYSGLMLPVLEDRILASRAIEGRFGARDLLLYSSVCGTGLDVIPLPGDTDAGMLSRLILDVAALSTRLKKPLAARLLPIPGKQAGDRVDFDNPHLTGSVVLSPG
jgi:uncharacterized protein (UPF0210 family)